MTLLYKVITQRWSGRSRSPHDVLNLWSPTYGPSVWGYVGIGMNSFGCLPMYSNKPSIDTYGLSDTVFELLSWLQNCFRPPARPGYDNKYRSRSYHFVERQKRSNLHHYRSRYLKTLSIILKILDIASYTYSILCDICIFPFIWFYTSLLQISNQGRV